MNQPAHIVLVGAGGHALVVAAAAAAAGLKVDGFLDDATDTTLSRLTAMARLGSIADLAATTLSPILCVGDLAARRRLLARGGWSKAATVIHPRAFVDPTARLGAGVFVGPGAIVQAHARVGDHAIVNSGALVEHECVLGANVHVAPGAVLAGNVSVGPHTLVGLGARVLPGRRIGSESVVGAGAVVLADVRDAVTVVGVVKG
jgi:sugar O-acyltransferase (sialic acid O-acetyltransferase NeuD family)